MNSLDRYIFRQCLTPLLFTLLIVTAVVWMTQSLQRIEIMVEYGEGLGMFAFLSVLIIPSLIAIIIPFALFGAVVYALYRLHTDSEIAVMFAAGVSQWRIAAPILLITAFCAIATFYVSTDLMPRSYRILKQRVADIRADIASSIIRSGEFTSLSDGFTVYVDDAKAGGLFIGLLVNDYRNPGKPETYMAERAVLQDTSSGPVLFLKNGNVQRTDEETGNVSIIRFEESLVNVSSIQKGTGELTLELTERYPSELLNPDMTKPYDRANAGKLIAEGHARYASPIYAFAYALIALYAMIGGSYNRRGYAIRAAIGGGAIAIVRVLGYIAQSIAESGGAIWLIYTVPAAAALSAAILLTIGPINFSRPTPEAEAA
ncbi:MAG: LptF/LptG family permease [Marinicaulis sp.]|nr:LptF/LptG family permease [Marinicaulis sp.]NNL88807.1 LptF/LptG family permease [Marinicaulis sp.]